MAFFRVRQLHEQILAQRLRLRLSECRIQGGTVHFLAEVVPVPFGIGHLASCAASPPMAAQSRLLPPRARRVRNRSFRRLATGRGTRNASSAANVSRMSLTPSGAV